MPLKFLSITNGYLVSLPILSTHTLSRIYREKESMYR